MATFTPPLVSDIPWVDRNDPHHPGFSLFRHYAPMSRGVNVYILEDGTVQQDGVYPAATLDRAFYGGRTYTDVSTAHAAILTAAGYTVT